jgi:hypothetical protein
MKLRRFSFSTTTPEHNSERVKFCAKEITDPASIATVFTDEFPSRWRADPESNVTTHD